MENKKQIRKDLIALIDTLSILYPTRFEDYQKLKRTLKMPEKGYFVLEGKSGPIEIRLVNFELLEFFLNGENFKNLEIPKSEGYQGEIERFSENLIDEILAETQDDEEKDNILESLEKSISLLGKELAVCFEFLIQKQKRDRKTVQNFIISSQANLLSKRKK